MSDAPERSFLIAIHNQVCFENGDHPDEVDTPYSVGADAITRADATAHNVRVKKLEWDGDSADSAIGQYHTMKTQNHHNDKYMVTYVDPYRKSHTLGYIDGRLSAKAAAQSDYEASIRSALGPADPLDDDLTVAYLAGVHDERAQNPLDHPKVKALVKALQWYADETNWEQTSAANDGPHDGRMRDVWNGDFADGWAIARSALAALEADT